MLCSCRLYLLTWHVYVSLTTTSVLNCLAMQRSPLICDFMTLAKFLLHPAASASRFPVWCRGLFLTLFLGQVGLRRKVLLERCLETPKRVR